MQSTIANGRIRSLDTSAAEGMVLMKILSSKERASRKGPTAWFTGNVWIDEIAVGAEPSRLRFFRVSFEPGARTAWHTHPIGQTLHVLTGSGLVQLEGQPVQEIHPGDTVTIAPNERHWHGAAPANTLVHFALQEADMQNVDVVWLEQVTDEEYAAR
jgi:quercetin dioxygenase-like cupin family protein